MATGKKKSTSGAKKPQAGRKTDVKSREDIVTGQEDTFTREVVLWIVVAVSLLLFISNLGIGGMIGNTVSRFFFGIFGLIAYVFPIALLVGSFFGAANKGNRVAVVKLGAAVLLVAFLCMFFSLIRNGKETVTAVEAFLYGYENKLGGGMIGGALAWVCCKCFGVIGAYVINVIVLIIALVLITERSALKGMQKGGKKVYESAKITNERYKERAQQRSREREERSRLRRMDRKVTGVAMDTRLTPEDKDPEYASDEVSEINMDRFIEFPKVSAERRVMLMADGQPVAAEISGSTPPAAEETSGKKNTVQPDFIPQETVMPPIEEHTISPAEHVSFWEEPDLWSVPEPVPVQNNRQPDARTPFTEQNLPPAAEEIPSVADPEAQEFSYRDTADWPQLHDEGKGDTHTDDAGELYHGGEELYHDRDAGQDDLYRDVEDVQEETTQGMESGYEPSAKPLPMPGKAASAAECIGQNGPEPSPHRPQASVSAGAASDIHREVAESHVKEPEKPYVFPTTGLLSKPEQKAGDSRAHLQETAIKLQQTLKNFGVSVTLTNISCGPAVTRYELQPEMGVKVSKIVNLADDIKLNLAATDIRIEAPIPGKAAVGIEVPNKENVMVSFRELVESDVFRTHPSRISFCVGKDIAGKVTVSDIAKMPHLLIAGSTGSGKSVCINTIVMSILYKADPKDVKLIMVDPKVVELSIYNGIPHLMIPVVTDPQKAAGALRWAVVEMDERYQKFAAAGVRDLKGYNAKIEELPTIDGDPKPEKLPQIVIIVDELADLMMVAAKDVEESICRLAQLARACGIHLIIATQRPSVNVITGLIKANMPSRIAFAVTSGIDSRTILDMNGAEKLLGKGDMLFHPQGVPKPIRVQGAFVSDKEVSDVVGFIKEQNGTGTYSAEVEEKLKTVETGNTTVSIDSGSGGDGRDSYFAEAAKLLMDKEKGSIGMLQRYFKIGFNRAARIMDQLEEAGIVGPEEGTKPRKILMTPEQFEQYEEEYL